MSIAALRFIRHNLFRQYLMPLRTIRHITLPMASISLLLLIVGASGAWYVHRLQNRSSAILSINVASIIAAKDLELQVRSVRVELNQFLITGDAQNLSDALQLKAEVEEQCTAAEDVASTEREQELIAGIYAGLATLWAELEKLVAEPAAPDSRQRVTHLSQQVLTAEVLTHSREYLELNEKELWRSNFDNQRMSRQLVVGLLLLGTCGAISGLLAGYGAARGIHRSILQLSLPVRDVAGKLNQVVGPVSISADPRLDDLESVLHAVAMEVESVIQRLHAREREIIRADQLAAVGQLAAGLAHELRNPLMCMKVLVQSARRGTSAGLDGRDLEVLDEEITRLEKRLQDFLDFARFTTPEKGPVNLRQLITQTIHFLGPRAERRSIRLLDNASPEPLWFEADEGQIRQVLLNLLLNALDAVSNGGTIKVRADYAFESANGNGQPPARSLVLEVRDDGRGLPSEHGERIFEPFFSTKDTGLGLGLATCKRIVTLHGGDITADDLPNGGARFRVRLPADASSPAVTNDGQPLKTSP